MVIVSRRRRRDGRVGRRVASRGALALSRRGGLATLDAVRTAPKSKEKPPTSWCEGTDVGRRDRTASSATKSTTLRQSLRAYDVYAVEAMLKFKLTLSQRPKSPNFM